MGTNEPERFSIKLDDSRRDLLERIDQKIEGNTTTASVLKAFELALDWKSKQQEAEKEFEEKWKIEK